MAKKKRNCPKGVVKTGKNKGKCRKVCPTNCETRAKYGKRKASKKRGKRANCAKWGFSERLGRCRKGPGGKRVFKSSSIFGPYASGYRFPSAAAADSSVGPYASGMRVASTGPGPWSDAYVGAQSFPAGAAVGPTRTPSAQEVKRMMARLRKQGGVF